MVICVPFLFAHDVGFYYIGRVNAVGFFSVKSSVVDDTTPSLLPLLPEVLRDDGSGS